MDTFLPLAEKDPMGVTIADYYHNHKADRLRVFSSQFDEDEIPVKQLFREAEQASLLEHTALQMATGRIFDADAGSGCHALAFQKTGKEVSVIDISPLSVEAMKFQGVEDACQVNLFDERFADTFDITLMLMNGSSITGRLENMSVFFRKMRQLLHPDGCILMDPGDLRYLFEDEDGSFLIDLVGDYYGEIDLRMQYKDIQGDSFGRLYIGFQTLSAYAADNGFKAGMIKEGKHYDYLAKLTVVPQLDRCENSR